jgi:oxygen-independent coproporphyrinogen III oxidase
LKHVYVHVPFCARRCTYCDFAIAVRRVAPVEDYVRGLGAELATRFGDPDRLPVETLYLGGGTPSYLGVAGVEQTLNVVRRWFDPLPGADVTLEANPDDVTDASAHAWRGAGVTRVSLGVQTFDDRVLAALHRTHTAQQIETSRAALVAAGLDWSLDLIFAMPREIERSWDEDLDRALALDPPHVSCYGLTVEAATPVQRSIARGQLSEASEEVYEREFLAAHDRLTRAGLVHYEVSNYARPGHESRHNRAYWARRAYVGLGPGAHEFNGSVRRWNEREYARWLERVTAGEDPCAGAEELTEEQVRVELAYLGLRTNVGLEVRDEDRRLLEQWCRAGWASSLHDRIQLTATGWLRLDALVVALTDRRSH